MCACICGLDTSIPWLLFTPAWLPPSPSLTTHLSVIGFSSPFFMLSSANHLIWAMAFSADSRLGILGMRPALFCSLDQSLKPHHPQTCPYPSESAHFCHFSFIIPTRVLSLGREVRWEDFVLVQQFGVEELSHLGNAVRGYCSSTHSIMSCCVLPFQMSQRAPALTWRQSTSLLPRLSPAPWIPPPCSRPAPPRPRSPLPSTGTTPRIAVSTSPTHLFPISEPQPPLGLGMVDIWRGLTESQLGMSA